MYRIRGLAQVPAGPLMEGAYWQQLPTGEWREVQSGDVLVRTDAGFEPLPAEMILPGDVVVEPGTRFETVVAGPPQVPGLAPARRADWRGWLEKNQNLVIGLGLGLFALVALRPRRA